MCLALFIEECAPPDFTESQSIALAKRHTGYELAVPGGLPRSLQSNAGMVRLNRVRIFFNSFQYKLS